jgi:acyl-CoA thioesterase
MALALVALGAGREGPSYEATPPPDIPPPEECEAMPSPPVLVPIRQQIEARHALGPFPFSGGDEAVTGGWLRMVDPEPTDAHVLVQAADAWIPAFFGVATSHPGVPTVDLTIHFRQAPVAEDGWLLVRFRTRLAAEGFLEEDGEIWDRDGRLLAQSRQLGVILP